MELTGRFQSFMAYCFGLIRPSVPPSVCASVTKIRLQFLNFKNRFVIKN